MIMHGDGHGGIYFHDGLLDTGGVLERRFDVVLTRTLRSGNSRK